MKKILLWLASVITIVFAFKLNSIVTGVDPVALGASLWNAIFYNIGCALIGGAATAGIMKRL
jgi:hypothetical protein